MSENFYADVETDLNLEKGGIYLSIGPSMAALLARAGGSNRAYEQARDVLAKPYVRQISAGVMKSDKVMDLIIKPAYARAVVKDFFCLIDGNAVSGIAPHPTWDVKKEELNDHGLLPVTEDNLLRLFRSPELSFIWDVIVEEADKAANYRREALEEKAKNSKRSSNTT